jgi:hypothetical protein
MTRLSTRSREEYAGTGTQSAFAFQFAIFDASDLRVLRCSAANVVSTLALGVDYSVTGGSTPAGGTVTLLAGPLAVGERLTIELSVPETQTADIRGLGTFQPSTHENALDRLAAMIQQLTRAVGRTSADAEVLRLGAALSAGDRRYNGQNHVLESLADAVAAQDAMNRRSVEAYVATILTGGPATVPGIADLTPNGVQTTWTNVAQVSGSAAEQYQVSLDGVVQTPYTDYVINEVDKSITFTTAPPSGAKVVVVNRGYARGYPQPAAYTSATLPPPSSSYDGVLVRVKDAGSPGTLQTCLSNHDGSVWGWVTVAIGPFN